MAQINIDDILQITLTWDAPLAAVAQNVWHLKMITGTGADSALILAEVLTNLQVAYALVESEFSDDYSGVLLEMRKWDFTLKRFDGVDTLAVTGVQGASAVDHEPHGVAALGRIITENARRQGRTFVPGMVDSSIVAGTLVAAAESKMALYLATFDGPISVVNANLQWCTFNVDPLSVLFETASLAAGVVIANSLPSYLSKRKPGTGL